MKQVKIKQLPNGLYGWNIINLKDVSCKCIMAVIKGCTIDGNDLITMYNRNELKNEEYFSIRNFDNESATKLDLKIIKELAKRNKVKVVVRKHRCIHKTFKRVNETNYLYCDCGKRRLMTHVEANSY